MRRTFAIAAALAALLVVLLVPAALAAEPATTTGSFVLTAAGTVDVPAGTRVEGVVVIDGSATIAGTVETLVVVDGTASLAGATVDTLVVVDGTATLAAGTTVRGDVYTLNGTVTAAPGAVVLGSFEALESGLAAFAIVGLPFLVLLFLGACLAAIAAGLVVAAFGARQVRGVESLIERQTGQVLVAGIVGAVALPTLAVVLMATVIGAPIGLGLLLVVLPALAFLGWLVAAIWIGDWLVGRMRGAREAEHPYLAAILGIVTLGIAGMLPFVTAIATFVGFGAVVLAGWRIVRPAAPPAAPAWAAQPGPSAA